MTNNLYLFSKLTRFPSKIALKYLIPNCFESLSEQFELFLLFFSVNKLFKICASIV